jgi:hypothetical protein
MDRISTVLDIATPHVLWTQAEYENAVAEVDRLLEVLVVPAAPF